MFGAFRGVGFCVFCVCICMCVCAFVWSCGCVVVCLCGIASLWICRFVSGSVFYCARALAFASLRVCGFGCN